MKYVVRIWASVFGLVILIAVLALLKLSHDQRRLHKHLVKRHEEQQKRMEHLEKESKEFEEEERKWREKWELERSKRRP